MSVQCASRSLTIAAKPASLSAVTDFVRQAATEANLPEDRLAELDLLVDELIMNVCSYAYPKDRPGNVTVTCSVLAPGELTVEVADQGVEFNPLKGQPPDLATMTSTVGTSPASPTPDPPSPANSSSSLSISKPAASRSFT